MITMSQLVRSFSAACSSDLSIMLHSGVQSLISQPPGEHRLCNRMRYASDAGCSTFDRRDAPMARRGICPGVCVLDDRIGQFVWVDLLECPIHIVQHLRRANPELLAGSREFTLTHLAECAACRRLRVADLAGLATRRRDHHHFP